MVVLVEAQAYLVTLVAPVQEHLGKAMTVVQLQHPPTMVQVAVAVQEQLVVTAIRLRVVLVVLGYPPRYLAQQYFMLVVAVEH
jgi:hypothetical protein